MIDASEMIDRHYRYSVKCGREMAKAIDKAAKAHGLSAESFVRRHFERILTEPVVATNVSKPQHNRDPRADLDVAKSLGVTISGLHLYRAMAAAADGNGNVRLSQLALADASGLAPATVGGLFRKLEAKKLIRLVEKAYYRTPAIYHVSPIGDDA